VPDNRLAGLFAPANGEFSTEEFSWPESGAVWLNVDAHWEQAPGGTCDEKCQAYVMVAVLDANNDKPIEGYEHSNCVLIDVDQQQLPLVWNSTSKEPSQISPGKAVKLRFYFRDATIYAVGAF
jgi:hypothetical protein